MAAPSYLVLDIETVPDRDLFAPPEPPAGTERERMFPPLYACRPVVIGAMLLDEHLAMLRLGTIGEGKTEPEMLGDFAAFMEGRRSQLVTWNGRGFDLPVLALRSLRHGLSWPWYYQDAAYRYRYTEQGHLDLGDFLADHGAARMTSLDGAARLIGLPGKDGVDGSQVEAMYQSGQHEALRQYCLRDVVQTAFLFLRYRLLAGQIARPTYQKAAAALLASVGADQRVSRLVQGVDMPRLLLG